MKIKSILSRTGIHKSEPCAAASRARNEDTAGTLGYFDIGMFVEGTTPFPRLALKSIAPSLHAYNIKAWQRYQQTGNGIHPRILPIRRDKQSQSESLVVLFSSPTRDGPNLQLRYEFTDYADLLNFDLHAMRDRAYEFTENQDDTFRVLICTHGKVDPCCAVDGNRLYRHLRERDDIELWHAAHFGGCRFAANVWCLPSGNCYGHVSIETIDELIDAERRNRVYSNGYRGRIGQPMHAAAAEYLVRKRYDNWDLNDVRVEVATDPSAIGEFSVHTSVGTQRGQLALSRNSEPFFTTCRSLEPSTPPIFRLDSLSSP